MIRYGSSVFLFSIFSLRVSIWVRRGEREILGNLLFFVLRVSLVVS